MPEPYWPKHRGLDPYMLSEAAKTGSLVEVRCSGCSPPRWYLPADLITLYGDVPCLNLDRMMRCEKCRRYLSVKVTMPTAEERQNIRVRRLDRIWWVKRVSWRDG
jgi:hypothetical protein